MVHGNDVLLFEAVPSSLATSSTKVVGTLVYRILRRHTECAYYLWHPIGSPLAPRKSDQGSSERMNRLQGTSSHFRGAKDNNFFVESHRYMLAFDFQKQPLPQFAFTW